MNVQVHCEHCDRSLYRQTFGLRLDPMVGKTIVLREGEDSPFGRTADRMEFCDWSCVEMWARSKRADAWVAAQESKGDDRE